jgi:hypothetical protein
MVYMGAKKSNDKNNIRKCHIHGDLAIPLHWKFVVKTLR